MHAQSPVDVIIGIRKQLAEFQRTSSREELLAALKVVCRAALPRQVPGRFYDHQAVEQAVAYLERHGFRPSGDFRTTSRRSFLISSGRWTTIRSYPAIGLSMR